MWGNKWGNIGETFCHLNPSKPLNPLLYNSFKNTLKPPLYSAFPATSWWSPLHPKVIPLELERKRGNPFIY